MSCPTLCNPMDHHLPGSSVHGILQARTLVAISFSRGSFQPRNWTCVSCVSYSSRWTFYHCTIWEYYPIIIPSSLNSLPPRFALPQTPKSIFFFLKKGQRLSHFYQVQCLTGLQTIILFISPTISCFFCYPHCTGEETEALSGGGLDQVTQLCKGMAGFHLVILLVLLSTITLVWLSELEVEPLGRLALDISEAQDRRTWGDPHTQKAKIYML